MSEHVPPGTPSLEALLDQQSRHWRDGDPLPVEALLDRHPGLRGHDEDLLNLIYHEVLLRERRGEAPSLEEYLGRFPHLDEQLRVQFDCHRALSTVRPTHLDPAAAAAPPAGRPVVPGYDVVGELGEGGMGAVYRVRDGRLRRELALKVLQPLYRHKPRLRQRFLEEAQIAGQLQHPGIVPIHELGLLADGRPFFTMKLVKGRTLAELFGQRPDPSHDRPRFLAIFLQVCQAVAYAHSKNVLHRDLKPANVMVGAFGEVQVMDWGLAKVLNEDLPSVPPATESAAASVVETDREDAATAGTQAGAVLGTLSYMAPEQARGEVERVDKRSDVFGLGAILCELLTGRPAYHGSPLEVKAQAQLGHVAAALAGLDGCGADGELVALGRACLQPRPEDRPADAAAVATAVAAYLAGAEQRLRRAELERAAAEVRAVEEERTRREAEARAAAERRARRLTVGLSGAVLGLVLLLGGGGWRLLRQEQERRIGVETALQQAEERREQGRLGEAKTMLEQARLRLGAAGPADLVRRLAEADSDLTLVTRLEAIHLRRATIAGGKYDLPTADQEYAQVFADWHLAAEGEDAATVAQRIRASAVSRPLVAALDDWAIIVQNRSRWEWLLAVARQADPDEWRNRFRDPVVRRDPEALARLAKEVNIDQLSPSILETLGLALRSARLDAVPVLTAARERYPQDFFLTAHLALVLDEAHKPAEAVAYDRVACALRPDAVVAYNNLGAALHNSGQFEEAIVRFNQALKLDPAYARAFNNLGQVYLSLGQPEKAAEHCRQALQLAPTMPWPHVTLGEILLKARRWEEAAEHCRQALQVAPNDPRAHVNFGHALSAQGHREEARAHFEAALRSDPDNDLAHFLLGEELETDGHWEEALAHYQQAVRINPHAAVYHYNLGISLAERKQYEEARAHYEEALRLTPGDADVHTNLGIILKTLNPLDEAAAHFRRAIAITPGQFQAHLNLADVLREKGQLDEAIAEYRLVIDLNGQLAEAHANLAFALDTKGLKEEALKEYRTALGLKPGDARTHYYLGCALFEGGRTEEAVKEYRLALEINSEVVPAVPAHTNLGNALRQLGRLDEAIEAYRRATVLAPKDSEGHINLAGALYETSRLEEALPEYRLALQLLPDESPHRSHHLRYFRQCEDMLAADRKLPAVLRGDARPASPRERLVLARFCRVHKHMYAACARFYSDVFEVRPEWADDLDEEDRYNAACAAALAGAGRGEDAANLNDQERSRLRRQALDWLRADLALWRQQADGEDQDRQRVRKVLEHWQKDSDLASLRDREALARLPEAERDACRTLWDEVTALLTHSGEPK